MERWYSQQTRLKSLLLGHQDLKSSESWNPATSSPASAHLSWSRLRFNLPATSTYLDLFYYLIAYISSLASGNNFCTNIFPSRYIQPQFEITAWPMHKMGFSAMNNGLCNIVSQCTKQWTRVICLKIIPSGRSTIFVTYGRPTEGYVVDEILPAPT